MKSKLRQSRWQSSPAFLTIMMLPGADIEADCPAATGAGRGADVTLRKFALFIFLVRFGRRFVIDIGSENRRTNCYKQRLGSAKYPERPYRFLHSRPKHRRKCHVQLEQRCWVCAT